MIKVLAIPNMTFDATSYYRAAGTFAGLYKLGVDATLFEQAFIQCPDGSKGMGWPSAIRYDIAFFQRSVGQTAINLCQYLKDCGLKIWYDMDDDLWNIPESFKIKKFYPEKVLKEIETMLQMADLITCSTAKLAEVIKEKSGKDANVVPNGWDYERLGCSWQ